MNLKGFITKKKYDIELPTRVLAYNAKECRDIYNSKLEQQGQVLHMMS